MEFKRATDILTERVTAADIAAECGVQMNTVARARLGSESPAFRSPPPGWPGAVVALAERRIRELQQLVDALRAEER